LLYYKSLLLKLYKGDLSSSLDKLDKAIKLIENEKDLQFLVKCQISKAETLLSIGNIKEAIAILSQYVNFQTNSENKARILYRIAYAHYKNSQYDESLSLLGKAITAIDRGNPSNEMKDIKIDIFNLYGHIFLIKGEYSKSIAYYENVSRNADNIIDKYETNFNLILLYSQSGRFEKANEYIELTKEIADKFPLPIFMIAFLLAIQSFKFEFGEYEESIRILKEINLIASKLGHKYYIFLSYSLIGDSYYYLNRLSKSEEYYDLAFTYMNEDNILEKIQYAAAKAILLKKGDMPPSIETVLLEAYTYYKDNLLIYNKTQIEYHLADYYLRNNQPRSACKYLSECLGVSKEKEYFAHLQREYISSKSLFDFAFANNIEKSFVKMIIDETISKPESSWLTYESWINLQKISEQLYDVNISAFGIGEIQIRGHLVPENEWRKKKWKYILIYLFLSRKKELTKDKIIDTFYPEYSIESADNVFHQIISRFRSLVKAEDSSSSYIAERTKIYKEEKPANKKTDSFPLISPLVIYEDKAVKINKNFSFKIDAVEFEKITSAFSLSRNIDKKIQYAKNAVGLYKGDFLEGLYDPWCEELRNKYKNDFINISECLIEILFDNKSYEEVHYYAGNLLKFDKLNEAAFEKIIKSYSSQNKPNMAKEKYNYMIKQYELELGEKPGSSFNEKIKNYLQ
jgi:DNA-binding SARP family transcriptional activator